MLNQAVYADRVQVGDHDGDGIPNLKVKFDRRQVAAILEPGEAVEILVEGEAENFKISGTDTIRVISKGKKNKMSPGIVAAAQTATPISTASNSTRLVFYHLDHLGTPQVMTDEHGEVVWLSDYQPFGEVNVTANVVGNEFRFPGQYYDAETGLHYNYHRYYDPSTGRYLTPDPSHSLHPRGIKIPYTISAILITPQEINKYSFVRNNPINIIDPLGLFGCNGTWKMQGWDRLVMTSCVCYWLCIPCDGPVIWGGGYRTLPSTIGNVIYQGGGGLESGDTCFCEKPGSEENCSECDKRKGDLSGVEGWWEGGKW